MRLLQVLLASLPQVVHDGAYLSTTGAIQQLEESPKAYRTYII
jgi:hypothetical protein